MFSAIRKRVTPSAVIATIALVFAMSGGAYAASKYVITSTKQISPKVLKSLQGKAGKAGANGAAGATGAAGAQGPAGPAGAKGENGAPGAAGAGGEVGAKGVTGTSVTTKEVKVGESACNKEGGAEFKAGSAATTACNGKTGFTETLPSGKTETGVATFFEGTSQTGSELPEASISFPIPLASSISNAYYFTREQVETEAFAGGCKWKVEEFENASAKPEAPTGTLCVFASEEIGLNHVGLRNPSDPLATSVGPAGEVLQMDTEGTGASGQVELIAAWAVTAP